MTVLLQILQKVANDLRPQSPPKTAKIVRLGIPKKNILILSGILGLLVLVATLGGATFLAFSPPESPHGQRQAAKHTPADILLSEDTPSHQNMGAPVISVVAQQLAETRAIGDVDSNKKIIVDTSPTKENEQLLSEAYLLLQDNKDAEAIQTYNLVLAIDADNNVALSGKMYALQRSGQTEEAVD